MSKPIMWFVFYNDFCLL